MLLAVLIGCAAGGSAPVVVPPIDDQRSARGTDPCQVLTVEQVRGIGIGGPGVADRAAEGARCAWRGDAGVLTLTLYVDGGGLETLARNSEPTTSRVRVAGYPALETFTGQGEFCQYDVGVAPAQVLMAALDAPRPDACGVLQSVLPQAIANLPAASG
jgi:hypothetical protein